MDVSVPRGCSIGELDKWLSGIRWRIDYATFGTLRNQEKEVPRLVESMRSVTQCLVWGEDHDEPFIEVFKQHTMFEAFSCALRTDCCPPVVKVQALQSFSILITHLRRADSTSYLLSVLNPFFEVPPDLQDEEVVAYFVTLLKGLALRLNSDNVLNCIVTRSDSNNHCMPVLNCSVGLVDHMDMLVQTAARTAVLSILSLEHHLVRAIVEEVTPRLLVPRLCALVPLTTDMHDKGMYLFQWMWSDAITGSYSSLNPLRWSPEASLDATIADLKRQAVSKRPVLVRGSSDDNEREWHYNRPQEAITFLERMMFPVYLDDLLQFVEDLFKLDISPLTAALQAQGFGSNLMAQ